MTVRIWRERPRIAVALLLAAIVVVAGVAVGAGMLADGSDDGALSAENRRAQSASQRLSKRVDAMRGQLSAARKEVAIQRAAQERANRKLKRARRRSARDVRKIRRLQRRLRRARR